MTDSDQSVTHEQQMEQRILRVMRKVLAKIVREVAPRAGHPSPLSDDTVDDIRECFNLISIRERELSEAASKSLERPYYPDQPQPTKVVKISRAVKVLPDH